MFIDGVRLKNAPQSPFYKKGRLVQKLRSNLTITRKYHSKLTEYRLSDTKLSGYIMNKGVKIHLTGKKTVRNARQKDGQKCRLAIKDKHENRHQAVISDNAKVNCQEGYRGNTDTTVHRAGSDRAI